jgi:hypothetical protein
MVEVFRAYFGGNFDEENIRNNFVLIYELLDGDHTTPLLLPPPGRLQIQTGCTLPSIRGI